jgi:hypothetical protein
MPPGLPSCRFFGIEALAVLVLTTGALGTALAAVELAFLPDRLAARHSAVAIRMTASDHLFARGI